MFILGLELLSGSSISLAAHLLQRRVAGERDVAADSLPQEVLLGLRPSPIGLQGGVGFRTRAWWISRLKFIGERRGRGNGYRLRMIGCLFYGVFFEGGLVVDYLDCLRAIISLPVIHPIAVLARMSGFTMLSLGGIFPRCLGSIGLLILMVMATGCILAALRLQFLWMGVRSVRVVLVVEKVLDREGDVGVSAVDGGDIQEKMVTAARKHSSLLPIIT